MTHPSDAALRMLALLAEGYGKQEAAGMAFPESGQGAYDRWRQVRPATLAALGAVSEIMAYAVARDRGLLRTVRA